MDLKQNLLFFLFVLLLSHGQLQAADLPVSSQAVLAVGGTHACQVQSDGSVKCWGSNKFGQLGNGNTEDSETPVTVTGLKNAVGVSAGKWHTCALLKNRDVKCWGKNKTKQIGIEKMRRSLTPVSVRIAPASQLAAGRNHTCARLSTGEVSCWGDNIDGQLGVQPPPGKWTSLPVILPNITAATFIAAGEEHSCAVLSDGQLLCWGDNHYGQLGHGVQLHQFFPPRPVSLADGALSVVTGRRHTCVLLMDRTVQCWGDNFDGQLGNGKREDALLPVRVMVSSSKGGAQPLWDVDHLSAGWHHTCSLLKNKDVYCWGSNQFGQLGPVIKERSAHPLPTGFTQVKALAAGGDYTCVIQLDGTKHCAGKIDTTPKK